MGVNESGARAMTDFERGNLELSFKRKLRCADGGGLRLVFRILAALGCGGLRHCLLDRPARGRRCEATNRQPIGKGGVERCRLGRLAPGARDSGSAHAGPVLRLLGSGVQRLAGGPRGRCIAGGRGVDRALGSVCRSIGLGAAGVCGRRPDGRAAGSRFGSDGRVLGGSGPVEDGRALLADGSAGFGLGGNGGRRATSGGSCIWEKAGDGAPRAGREGAGFRLPGRGGGRVVGRRGRGRRRRGTREPGRAAEVERGVRDGARQARRNGRLVG